jgi:hypothetical protein
MKGTPTIGKAKSLKEKRELAAELGMSPTPLYYLPNVLTTTLIPSYSHLKLADRSPWSMSKTDNAEAVQEFEAKRGVSDPPEERASRSKEEDRRPVLVLGTRMRLRMRMSIRRGLRRT